MPQMSQSPTAPALPAIANWLLSTMPVPTHAPMVAATATVSTIRPTSQNRRRASITDVRQYKINSAQPCKVAGMTIYTAMSTWACASINLTASCANKTAPIEYGTIRVREVSINDLALRMSEVASAAAAEM